MQIQCSAKSHVFARVESRQVVAALDGGAVSSETGALCWDQGLVVERADVSIEFRAHKEAFPAFCSLPLEFDEFLLFIGVQHGFQQTPEMLSHGKTRALCVVFFKSLDDFPMFVLARHSVMVTDGRVSFSYFRELGTHSP